MSKQQNRRTTIVELRRAGNSACEIMKMTKFPKATVYRTVKEFDQSGKTTRKVQKTRKDKIRTETFLDELRKDIEANPGTSQKDLAKTRGVARSLIAKAIKNDLGNKIYRLRVRHSATKKPKQKRPKAPNKTKAVQEFPQPSFSHNDATPVVWLPDSENPQVYQGYQTNWN